MANRIPEEIQSEQNQWLKLCKSLQQKKNRQETGLFVAEGLRFVEEALAHGMVERLLIDGGKPELWQEATVKQALQNEAIKVYNVREGLLEKVLKTANPQGICAVVKQPRWNWQDVADYRQILILDGVQDPGNVGTMIRTALASDTRAVVFLKGTVDLYNDKVLRSTMGALFQLPIFFAENAEATVAQLHDWGYQILVSDIRAEQYHHQITYPDKVALVVSNEANGPQLIKSGDMMVKIPLYREAESLNVAIAAGILMYAVRTSRDIE